MASIKLKNTASAGVSTPPSGYTAQYFDETGTPKYKDDTGTVFNYPPIGTDDIATANIQDDAVTFSKMQNIITDSLMGRDTAGTGNPENIGLNSTLEMDGSGNLRRAALTGDVSASAGSNATTLATVNSNTGTFGSATQVAQVTLDGKGRATAAANVNIAIPSTQITDFTEAAQDAIGAALDATLVYVDGSNSIGRAAITGDVTISSGSNAATIANDAVTFAKMQNIATDSLIGRDTASTGDPENITLGVSLEMSGSGSLQRAALTGDVTASANSNATTIANDAVTFAKMQNIATDSLVGRDTAGTGDPENITLNATLEMSGSGALQRAALTGDVTASAGSNATTIPNNTVTYAKMQDIATDSLIGRDTAGTGDPETVTLGSSVAMDGSNHLVRAALTGDVTASQDSNATTIANNAVTNAKLADMAQNTIRGRVSSGTGDPEDLTGTQATTILDLATTSLKGLMSTTDKKRMGQVYDAVADLGFVGDLKTFFDGTCSTGAPTKITSATASFVAGDNGKRITLAEAGASGAQYTGTITAVDSATQVTVSPSISSTVSNKGMSYGTDNTSAITAMMTLVNTTNASFPGTKIIFGKSETNAYGFPIPVVFNKNVSIEGNGGAFNADNGDYTRIGGTRLAWWGTNSDGGVDFGAFFTFVPAGGANQALKSVSVKDLWIDGRNGDQNQALYGIRFTGCHSPQMDNVFIMDFRAAGIICHSTSVSLSPASDQGVLRPSFRNVNFRQIESYATAITTPLTLSTVVTLTNTAQAVTASGTTLHTTTTNQCYAWVATNEGIPCLVIYTGGGTTSLTIKCSTEDAIRTFTTVSGGNIITAGPYNGSCMVLDGNTTSNTNCGILQMMQLSHGTTAWGPAAIEVRNADSMEFISIFINGGIPTDDGIINRIRKEGVRFTGSNHATPATAQALSARNNVFRSGDPSSSQAAGVSAMALTNAASTLMTAVSGPNYWYDMQMGNGARIPKIEGKTSSATQGDVGAIFSWNPNGGAIIGAHHTSVADQAIAAATLSHLLGSAIPIPPQGFQVGTTFKWTIIGTGGAAGTTAGHLFTVRLGTAGSTADAAVATFTQRGAPTAAASDFRIQIELTVRTLGGAATAIAKLTINNVLTATGAAGGFSGLVTDVLAGTMATFNSTTAQQYMHVCLQTAAAKTATIQQVIAEVVCPANP